MLPGGTMTMAWSPDRPGNWLFHCHIGFHVIPEGARFDPAGHATHDHNHMAGLVLGIQVQAPEGSQPPARPDPARLRMLIQEQPPHRDSMRTIGIAIGPPGAEGDFHSPGPILLAERGRPLDVAVVNRLAQSTALHWHGLELFSYWDGVAGWSGAGPQIAQPIAAGDSFVAHLTVPRSGTFIYHTHLNDLRQMSAGLYGPLIVLEPGAVFDPARDHVFTIGWDGFDDSHDPTIVNGAVTAAPLELAAGVAHRLRFINIGIAGQVALELRRDATLARWRVVAVDGADLPSRQQWDSEALRVLDVGMTFDALFTPAPGEYLLQIPNGDTTYSYRQRIIAH
jgi:FtsP/CotA-like multicopper oxidase with cupredoxin domain